MITPGKKVIFDYVLTIDGQEIESSDKNGKLEYVHGEGKLVKGLEKELENMKVGEQKKIVVSPEEGYGYPNAKALHEVPRSTLPSNIEPKVGMRLQAQDREGKAFTVTVAAIKENVIVVDFNHPLAGKELHFDVTIADIK